MVIDIYTIMRPFLQPFIGAFHGWFATRMVVVMLFRPHKEYYVMGKQVPFTPGIFPRRKSALATNIGRTVTETLLTPEDIQKKIDEYITEDTVYKFISVTFDKFSPKLENPALLEKISSTVNNLIPSAIDNTALSLVNNIITDKNEQLTKLTEYLVNEVFLNIKISEENATSIVNYVFDNFISPVNIRLTLHNALTPERAINLQNVLRERTTGALKFILSLANLEGIFNNFKEYLKNEPEKSEELISEIITQLKVREDLISKIVSIDFKKLSFDDVENIKKTLKNGISNYLQNNQPVITKALGNVKESVSNVIKSKINDFKISNISESLLEKVKKEISNFVFNYLKNELANLVNKGIDALKPREMIESKINAYSSQNVEDLILGIMRKELKNLEYLGLIIGLLLGIIAFFIEYFLPYK